MFRDNNKLYELTDTTSPAETLAEIKNILKEMGLSFNTKMDEDGLPIPQSE